MGEVIASFVYVIGWMALIIVGVAAFLVVLAVLFFLALTILVWVAEKAMKKQDKGDHMAGVSHERED